MLPDRIITLLEKERNGTCTLQELEELNQWYSDFDSKEQSVLDRLESDPGEASRIQLDLWDKINGATQKEEELPERQTRPFANWWMYAAAACAGLLLLTWSMWSKPEYTAAANEITVTTKPGETLKILLPDSSSIWLKPESSVRYMASLNQGKVRELTFTGEGFFDIYHNAAKPFIVHTPDVDIRVLGTSFNVRAYKADSLVETALVTGKVVMESKHDGGHHVELVPNQKAVFHKGTQLTQIQKFESVKAIAGVKRIDQKQVAMTFDERPFTEVLKRIEEKFGVRIFIDERNTQKCPFTANLENEKLEDILSMLFLTHGISYSQYGGDIYMQGKICN